MGHLKVKQNSKIPRGNYKKDISSENKARENGFFKVVGGAEEATKHEKGVGPRTGQMVLVGLPKQRSGKKKIEAG